MSRLIDADALKERISEIVKKQGGTDIDLVPASELPLFIDVQPTAYYPDKVVEQLEKEFKKYYGENWNKAPYLVKAIEIVKGGGVNG